MLLGHDSCIGDNGTVSLERTRVLDNRSEMTGVLLVYEARYKSDIDIIRKTANCETVSCSVYSNSLAPHESMSLRRGVKHYLPERLGFETHPFSFCSRAGFSPSWKET